MDDLLLRSRPHTENKRGMSKEKEDEGGKTAMTVDNQWIKKRDTRSSKGQGNSWVKMRFVGMGCETSDGREQRGRRQEWQL